jgi:hypothetical protein
MLAPDGYVGNSGFQLNRGDVLEAHPARAARVGPSRWLWPVGRFAPTHESSLSPIRPRPKGWAGPLRETAAATAWSG